MQQCGLLPAPARIIQECRRRRLCSGIDHSVREDGGARCRHFQHQAGDGRGTIEVNIKRFFILKNIEV